MGHGHSHAGHAHGGRDENARRVAVTLVLAAAYMGAEVVGGVLSGSLALLADAGHMLSDVAALGLALFAMWVARRPATPQKTFGYHRAEILAALANGAALVGIAISIFVEAIERLQDPRAVGGGLMLSIATGGLVVNVIGLFLLHGGRGENLNVQGAWLHVLTDALGSVGAMLAGGLIWAFGWTWADPAASIAIALLVSISALALVRETLAVLMQSTPAHLDLEEVEAAMGDVEGVSEIHDVHAWSLSTGRAVFSAHVVTTSGTSGSDVLQRIRSLLQERFSIDHVTIQVEDSPCPHGACALAGGPAEPGAPCPPPPA